MIILIMEPEGNLHDHVFVREMADIHVTTVKEAADVANALLLPGV
jgi:hypothetical protein